MNGNERQIHDAKLGAAIDNAAGYLPDGYSIRIEIERGSVFVTHVDPDLVAVHDHASGTTADEISEALARCISDSGFKQSLLNR